MAVFKDSKGRPIRVPLAKSKSLSQDECDKMFDVPKRIRAEISEQMVKDQMLRNQEVCAAMSAASIRTRPFMTCNISKATKEKPMSLEITRPVLVGQTNILTASPEMLGHVIREARKQMSSLNDLAKESKYYQKKQRELNEVVKLCVEQLDKDLD